MINIYMKSCLDAQEMEILCNIYMKSCLDAQEMDILCIGNFGMFSTGFVLQ